MNFSIYCSINGGPSEPVEYDRPLTDRAEAQALAKEIHSELRLKFGTNIDVWIEKEIGQCIQN